MTTTAPPRTRADWMLTHSGRAFYPLAPEPADVHPGDIAHSLALQCRYNGHVRRFYSVAEHCVLMARHALNETGDEKLALHMLLHDSAETYVGDMVRPLKRSMPDFEEAERWVLGAIYARFGLLEDTPALVKEYDNRILLTERDALLPPSPLPWAPYLDTLEPLPVTVRGWEWVEARFEYGQLLGELTGEQVTW